MCVYFIDPVKTFHQISLGYFSVVPAAIFFSPFWGIGYCSLDFSLVFWSYTMTDYYKCGDSKTIEVFLPQFERPVYSQVVGGAVPLLKVLGENPFLF